MVRLFFTLVNAYLQVILSLIFGPLQLLTEAIPGSNGLSSWLSNLVVNLLAFPITAAMILLAYAFTSQVAPVWESSPRVWTPPFVLGSGATASAVSAIFSLGILILIPQIINSVKEQFKAKAAIPVGAAAGQAFSSPLATGMQILSAAYYIRGIVPSVVLPKTGLEPPQTKK